MTFIYPNRYKITTYDISFLTLTYTFVSKKTVSHKNETMLWIWTHQEPRWSRNASPDNLIRIFYIKKKHNTTVVMFFALVKEKLAVPTTSYSPTIGDLANKL